MHPQRLIDANLNRLREGLRVCEDIARFGADDAVLCRRFKALRHDIQAAIESCRIDTAELIKYRNIDGDVGKKSNNGEKKRSSLFDIFCTNAQRCKESLRVLEETTKLINRSAPEKFKLIRHKFYSLEKHSVDKLESLRNHR
ncbi:MAG: thiamine-phosphate pyrophosphorylase [Candidatus Omnitrophota bacterium]